MSNYTPKTETQLAQESLMPNGIYDCEVSEAIDKPSKAGNPMITLKLNVFADNGGFRVIYDYIVPSTSFGARKLRHASDAFGLMDKYEGGTVWADDFANQMAKVEIGQSKGTPEYPLPKNVVVDYISRSEATEMQMASKKPKKELKDDLGDEIPF